MNLALDPEEVAELADEYAGLNAEGIENDHDGIQTETAPAPFLGLLPFLKEKNLCKEPDI